MAVDMSINETSFIEHCRCPLGLACLFTPMAWPRVKIASLHSARPYHRPFACDAYRMQEVRLLW